MARAEDAGKINRIIEQFGLATVDMAQVKQEIEQSRVERRMDARKHLRRNRQPGWTLPRSR